MGSRLFFFMLLMCLVFACSEKSTDKQESDRVGNKTTESDRVKASETSIEKEKFEELKLKKPVDSINNKNAVAFLEKYGALNPETQLVVKTRLGDIGLRLYEDTPLHRASFVFLTKVGYFDTTCFYRVVPDFIIQGGESERLDTQRYKARYMRYKIPPEFRDNRNPRHSSSTSFRIAKGHTTWMGSTQYLERSLTDLKPSTELSISKREVTNGRWRMSS